MEKKISLEHAAKRHATGLYLHGCVPFTLYHVITRGNFTFFFLTIDMPPLACSGASDRPRSGRRPDSRSCRSFPRRETRIGGRGPPSRHPKKRKNSASASISVSAATSLSSSLPQPPSSSFSPVSSSSSPCSLSSPPSKSVRLDRCRSRLCRCRP